MCERINLVVGFNKRRFHCNLLHPAINAPNVIMHMANRQVFAASQELVYLILFIFANQERWVSH